MPHSKLDVLVCGAGVAGLSTAIALRMHGHRVAVLEAASPARPVGAGLLLQPPALDALDALGAGDAVRAGGSAVLRLDARNTRGRRLLDVGYADLGPGMHGLGVRRPLLWQSLAGSAEAHGIEIRTGSRVTGVRPRTEGSSVDIAGMPSAGADLVVIASGTHTPLRARGGRHVSRVYPWGCLWASVLLPDGWPDDVLLQRCAGSRHMVGVLPTGPDEAGRRTGAFFWSIRNDAVEAWRDRPISLFHEEVGSVWPEVLPLVSGLGHGDLVHAVYRDTWADPPHGERVISVGDAAHGMSPQLGQGATAALRDAMALASALDLPGSLESRLRAYWESRRARTSYYRQASRFLTPFFQTSYPGFGPLRDLFAGPVGRVPFVRRQAVLTLAGFKTGLLGADRPGPCFSDAVREPRPATADPR